MKAWLQALRGMRWLALAGLLVALAVAVSRGQALPSQIAECGEPPSWTAPRYSEGEPPLSDAPRSPQAPAPPFSPPSPRPLPPGGTMPFVPHMPAPIPDPLAPPEPIVRLRIGAPSRVEPGKEIEYRLTVENISRADAHHVVLRDRLPRGVKEAIRAEPKAAEQHITKDGFTDLLWELNTVKAGEHKTIVLAIKPTGTEDVENRAYVQFEHGQKVTTRIAKPGVQVKVTVPAQTMKYESILLRVEVVNTGAVPLRNVVLTDELPGGLEFFESKPTPNSEKPLTWKLGDLPPGQTRRVEYQVICKETGTFRNKANVKTEGGASAAGSGAVTVVEPNMKITIRGPQRRLANRPIPYHMTVRNLGSVALTNVQVADELPPGIKFDSVDASGRKEGEFVRWSLGTLPPGEHRSLRLVLRATKTGKCWIQAEVQADNHLSDKALSEETKIQSANTPVIEIDKETDSLVVGQKATYTIRLFNPGKSNVLRPSVVVSVPDEMRIRGLRGPTTGRDQEHPVHFDPLTVLEAGKEELYYVEVEAAKAGLAKLRAWWTAGFQNPGNPDSWEDHTMILAPAASATPIPRQLSASGGSKPAISLHQGAYAPCSPAQ